MKKTIILLMFIIVFCLTAYINKIDVDNNNPNSFTIIDNNKSDITSNLSTNQTEDYENQQTKDEKEEVIPESPKHTAVKR